MAKKVHQQYHKNKGGMVGGLILLALGVLFLAQNFVPGVNFSDIWPVVLIVVGGAMLWGALN